MITDERNWKTYDRENTSSTELFRATTRYKQRSVRVEIFMFLCIIEQDFYSATFQNNTAVETTSIWSWNTCASGVFVTFNSCRWYFIRLSSALHWTSVWRLLRSTLTVIYCIRTICMALQSRRSLQGDLSNGTRTATLPTDSCVSQRHYDCIACCMRVQNNVQLPCLHRLVRCTIIMYWTVDIVFK